MTEHATSTPKLSPRQREAMSTKPMRAHPDSIHVHDREPEQWLRCEPKPTVRALQRLGLVDEWWFDYPIGGYRAHLTALGMEVRAALRAEGAEARAACLKIAQG